MIDYYYSSSFTKDFLCQVVKWQNLERGAWDVAFLRHSTVAPHRALRGACGLAGGMEGWGSKTPVTWPHSVGTLCVTLSKSSGLSILLGVLSDVDAPFVQRCWGKSLTCSWRNVKVLDASQRDRWQHSSFKICHWRNALEHLLKQQISWWEAHHTRVRVISEKLSISSIWKTIMMTETFKK